MSPVCVAFVETCGPVSRNKTLYFTKPAAFNEEKWAKDFLLVSEAEVRFRCCIAVISFINN